MEISGKLILEYSKKLSLLYVEDDDMLREATQKVLENYFSSVDVAVDGEDGLNKYLQYHKSSGSYYDLVISDISMPNMDGIEMSREIMRNNPEQSLIFITAFNEVSYLQSAIDIGVTGFLTKPINQNQLKVVLYKATQAISDRKDVAEYYKKMEDLNIQLEKQYEELKSKNTQIEKSSRVLDTMVKKSQILNKKQKKKENKSSNESKEDYTKQLEQFIHEDLSELEDLVEEMDVVVISILESNNGTTQDEVDIIIKDFTRYAAVVSFYGFTQDLYMALNKFVSVVKNNPIPDDEDNVQNIFMILESFMFVLQKWHTDLKSNDLGTVNFLDASIISDLSTIENMWTNKFEEVADEDLDDMFF